MKKALIKTSFILLFSQILHSQIVWGPDIKLSPPNDSMREYEMSATVWKDTIHLVYYALHSPSLYDIFYMRSVDGGQTWEGPRNLTLLDPDKAIMPWIACSHKKVHVVYTDSDSVTVMYIRSLDGGATWEFPIKLIKPAAYPVIACKGDTVVVVVPAPGLDRRVWLRKSYDGGTTWSPQKLIDSVYLADRIEIRSDFIHRVGGKRLSADVFYFRSPDLGETWKGPFAISPIDEWSSYFPALAVVDSNIYITWNERMYCGFGQWDNINLRKSDDNGNSFSERKILSNLCRSFFNDIYAKDSIVVVVYTDDRHNPGHWNFEVYWRASYDYGNTFTEEERLTYGGGECQCPILCGWGNNIYLFWVDNRTGRYEVFFKKGVYTNIKEQSSKINSEIKILSSNILILPQKIKFFVKEGEKYSFSLFNLNGQKILNLKEGIGKGIDEIILDKISSGNYFLILETKEKIFREKILILKGGKE